MWQYTGKNIRPFSAVCSNSFGRKLIETNASTINGDNIAAELAKALVIHNQNRVEIMYLDNYYKGDQPILYRRKEVRPEVNNRIVENLAYMIVESKTADMVGEPIQYVLRGDDEGKSEQITNLNVIMESEDKAYYDIELCRWRSICGTAYRFVGQDNGTGRLLDESPFYLSTENPADTFICYYAKTDRAAFSCQIRKDEDNQTIYNIYTDREFFVVKSGEVIYKATNGNFAIPVIEYPNNARRISDIEITISITDEINKMASDRSNGIEQFVSSWVKFVNCEIDADTFAKMRQEGALVVKSNNGTDNKADVDIMSSELNQTQSQVAVSDQYDKLLVIQGLATRQENTGGDTQGAVQLRNGHYDAEKRAELSEPIFKRAERNMLRIVLKKLRVTKGFSLLPSDVEIHVSRTKMDNMQVKAEVLKMLLDSGINPERAIKTIGLFSDPEQVAIESRDRMNLLYPTEVSETETVQNTPVIVDEE